MEVKENCAVVEDHGSIPVEARAELYFGPSPYDVLYVCADHVHFFADVVSVRKLD